MHGKELNERSPLRVLDQSIHGGLGRGNVGVIAARHGVGKTAFLVGVALDDLMRGRQVLHVTLEETVDHVQRFYDDVFMDLARNWELDDVWRARVDLERNRRILCYSAGALTPDRLRDSIRFWRDEGRFEPAAIIVEGYDFGSASVNDVGELRTLARDTDAELWMSAVHTRASDRNERGVPEPLAHVEAALDVILTMAHDGKAVRVKLLKDHDNPRPSPLALALDPTTMLLVRE